MHKKVSLLSAIFIFVILVGCIKSQYDKPKKWKSAYHDISFEYNYLWTHVESSDLPEVMEVGVVDEKDGKSYFIQSFTDLPDGQDIYEEKYLELVKKNILKSNVKNKLLSEEKLIFHGEEYHRMIFLTFSNKFGVIKSEIYNRQQGAKKYAIQISYPVDEEDAEITIMPRDLYLIDKTVKIDGK